MSRTELRCTVIARHLPEQSRPDEGVYAFGYTVNIHNTGDVAAQVIGRHWIITDATGTVEEVRGLGVVGHQPLLQPGEQFEYSSGARLATPTGTMRGHYLCVTDAAQVFESPIPEFMLAVTASLH